jgi:hypothetical protein
VSSGNSELACAADSASRSKVDDDVLHGGLVIGLIKIMLGRRPRSPSGVKEFGTGSNGHRAGRRHLLFSLIPSVVA